MLFNAISLLCALLIGFAAHRASLCNVRAVAEIMSAGSAHMLWSLLQAVLWMATLTGVLVVGFGQLPQPAFARTPVVWALAGGGLFGIGAALNGGCSLSTLHRLADGELGMLATLGGFALGVTGWRVALAARWPADVSPVVSVWLRWPDFAPWLLTALLAWALLRLLWFRQLARQHAATPMRQRLLAPSYHLSMAAALMGVAGGLLYATQGPWSYTNYLRTTVLHALGNAEATARWHGVLVVALISGMLASALQRGSLTWRLPHHASVWLRHAGGGALMGVGAAMLPGGNDTLLLNGLPTLTVTAISAYVFMLLGIASVLWWMRHADMPMPSLACTPAGCHEQRAARPK